MAEMDQFVTVTARRDLKAGEWVTQEDVSVWASVPHDIVGRIVRACDRLYRDTRRRASTVILGRREWHELEHWYRDSYRYFGTGADLFEAHAAGVLGAVPVVDPLSESRITPVFEPRLTAFMSPELFRS